MIIMLPTSVIPVAFWNIPHGIPILVLPVGVLSNLIAVLSFMSTALGPVRPLARGALIYRYRLFVNKIIETRR